MWVFLNDAFLSIVDSKAAVTKKKNTKPKADDVLLVRARLKGDIERVFGEHVQVTKTPLRDYQFRALITRKEVQEVLAREVNRVTYGNFKNSVTNNKRHDVYEYVWSAAYRLQCKISKKSEDWWWLEKA